MPGIISNKKSLSSLNSFLYGGLNSARQYDLDTRLVPTSGAIQNRLHHLGLSGVIDPVIEHEYWRESLHNRIYVDSPDEEYERYASAYQFGWESYARFGKDEEGYEVEFDDVEHDLGLQWAEDYEGDGLSWIMARPATRDAWERASYITRQAATRKKLR